MRNTNARSAQQRRSRQPATAPIGKQLTLPDILSLLNALAGFTAILFALRGKLGTAAAAIVVAVVLDMLDGALARRFGAVHELGKQLDSLADFLSFGIAPAVLLYARFGQSTPGIVFPLALFVLCGALRLARFNTLALKDAYLGIPITANGLIIPMLIDLNAPGVFAVTYPLLMAAVMVSSFRIKKTQVQYLASALIVAWLALHFLR